ncbi:putative protein C3orf22, partial [Galemys pyrenaicus]
FSWLTETTTEFLKPWEITTLSSSLREQLPLQKSLVPTRSIPVRGFGAPDSSSVSRLRPPPPPSLSPESQLWELQLLNRRFPRPEASTGHPSTGLPQSPHLHHLAPGAPGSRGLPSGWQGVVTKGS